MDEGNLVEDSRDMDQLVDKFIDFCHADYLRQDN